MKTHILLRNNHYDTRVILNIIFFLFDIDSFFSYFPFFSNMDIYIQVAYNFSTSTIEVQY